MRSFVDSDHAGELTTRQSLTGFIIFLNSSPIYWLFLEDSGLCLTVEPLQSANGLIINNFM